MPPVTGDPSLFPPLIERRVIGSLAGYLLHFWRLYDIAVFCINTFASHLGTNLYPEAAVFACYPRYKSNTESPYHFGHCLSASLAARCLTGRQTMVHLRLPYHSILAPHHFDACSIDSSHDSSSQGTLSQKLHTTSDVACSGRILGAEPQVVAFKPHIFMQLHVANNAQL